MNHPLQCRCGTLKGHVMPPEMANRAICYCTDCQAYAHFLGKAEQVLDAQGGSDIVATLPRHVVFTQGRAHLVCMSLSDNGLLRWYASCCNTPIGNTPRSPKTSYVGLLHSCLSKSQPSLQESFGPVRAVLNEKSAKGPVQSPAGLRKLSAMLNIMKAVLGARFSGSYKRNPFFNAEGKPIKPPRVLTPSEREKLMKEV